MPLVDMLMRLDAAESLLKRNDLSSRVRFQTEIEVTNLSRDIDLIREDYDNA